ncbi:MAG: hypothetical protein HY054_15230 [Proteobacteria bacterium]|nr:hypothetical protein [Pseudomonadota bacterium]
MNWRKISSAAAFALAVANEVWVGSMIWERFDWHGFQDEKACCVVAIISGTSFWWSFPWLAASLALAAWSWPLPGPAQWSRLLLGAIAVSEGSFIWSFAALYAGHR